MASDIIQRLKASA